MFRLPATDPADDASPGVAPVNFDALVDVRPPVEAPPADAAEARSGAKGRPGVFQKAMFDAAWLPRFGENGFGMTDLQLQTVLGFPFPTRASPLLVSPAFGVHFLNGPAWLGLPPEVYDAYVDFRWLSHLTPQWGLNLAVTPGYFSDYREQNSGAVRITGHAIAAWTWTPTTTLVLGASYLNRTDVPALPVCGIMWKPNEDAKVDLVFPQPKISHRIYWNGACNPQVQDWVYVGGELGGGTWGVERSDGVSRGPVLSRRPRLRRYRAQSRPGRQFRLELGFVFARKIQFDNEGIDFVPERHADAPRRIGVLSNRKSKKPGRAG